MAMQMLYQHELGGATLPEIFDSFDLEDYVHETDVAESNGGPEVAGAPSGTQVDEAFAYARRLVEGASEHGEAIDALIRRFAENWRLERMPIIDRNILRLAIYEMLYESSVPKVVIVDEAIELAKKFGSENSGRFVNGLLDGVLKSDDLQAVPAALGESAAPSPGEGPA